MVFTFLCWAVSINIMAMLTRLALISQTFICRCLLSARVNGVCHHTRLLCDVFALASHNFRCMALLLPLLSLFLNVLVFTVIMRFLFQQVQYVYVEMLLFVLLCPA